MRKAGQPKTVHVRATRTGLAHGGAAPSPFRTDSGNRARQLSGRNLAYL